MDTQDLPARKSSVVAVPAALRRTAKERLGQRDDAAVGYVRRSTDRQEQSIDDQSAAVEAYCRDRGLRLLRLYIDDAVSGAGTAGRKGFQRLLSDAQGRACDFGAVVVYDIKRFGRVDNDEAGYYRYLLRTHGVEIHYSSENFTGDDTDDLLRPVKQWQAREESKDLAKVCIRGLLSRCRSGCWMGGVPPFGFDLRYQSQSGQFLLRLRYNRDGSKLVLDDQSTVVRKLQRRESIAVARCDRCRLVLGDPERVRTVRRIYEMYAEQGLGLKRIADTLNRDQVPTARDQIWASHYSGQWSQTAVGSLLTHPAYCGDMVWNRKTDARFFKIEGGQAVARRQSHARRMESNDRRAWIVTKGAHPPIVSRWIWETVQHKLGLLGGARTDDRATPGARSVSTHAAYLASSTGVRARFLLSGVCSCSRCGRRYEGLARMPKSGEDWTGGKRDFYVCGGYLRQGAKVCRLGEVPLGALERCVVDAMVAHLSQFRGPIGADQLAKAAAASFQHDHIVMSKNPREETRSNAELQESLAPAAEEIRDLLAQTEVFLGSLESVFREGTLDQRRSAIYRCVNRVWVDTENSAVRLEMFVFPAHVARAARAATETVSAVLRKEAHDVE